MWQLSQALVSKDFHMLGIKQRPTLYTLSTPFTPLYDSTNILRVKHHCVILSALENMVSFLNQGKGNTCTIYALSNAVQDSLNSVSVNVEINRIIGALQHSVKNEDVINGIFPYKFQGFQIKNQINVADSEYGNISIEVKKKNTIVLLNTSLCTLLIKFIPGFSRFATVSL